MDKETLRNMDQKTYQKMLEDAAFDEINTMLNISKGHSQELHEKVNWKIKFQSIHPKTGT